MNPHAEFLQTIYDSPDDDLPRLVYADWLEENGFVTLAEFIRVQIELARKDQFSHLSSFPDIKEKELRRITERDPRLADLLKREWELWEQRKSWRRMPPGWLSQNIRQYQRGFLNSWNGNAIDFLRYARRFGSTVQFEHSGYLERMRILFNWPNPSCWEKSNHFRFT